MTARALSNCIRGRSSLCSNMAAGSAALCQATNNTRTHFPNSFPFGDTVHWFRGKPFAQISITKRSLVIILLLSSFFSNQLSNLKRRSALFVHNYIYMRICIEVSNWFWHQDGTKKQLSWTCEFSSSLLIHGLGSATWDQCWNERWKNKSYKVVLWN